jgi:branched-chain amino acid transport system permease protein
VSANTIVNGLLLGGLYTVIALGLSLVFGVMRMINLAYGEFLVGGAFLAYYVTDGLGVDPLVSLLIVVPAFMVLAYPIQRYVLSPLLVRGPEPPLVATFGIALVIQSLLTEAFTGNPKSLTASYAESGWSIGSVDLRVTYVIALVLAIVLVIGLNTLLKKTRYGTAIRAASVDPETTGMMGVNVKHVYSVTFAIAAGLAAIGGVLVGLTFSFTPTTGTTYLIKGFTVVVLGGIGSITGTLYAGLFLGVAESVSADLLGGAYRDLTVYLVFLAILFVRPQGFFGKKAFA